MCSLQEHIEREIRARQQAEQETADLPQSAEPMDQAGLVVTHGT
jgi:hypothetical protein